MFTPPAFLCSVDRDRCAFTVMLLRLTVQISILGVIPRSCAAEYGQRCALRMNLSVFLLQLHLRWWHHAFRHPPRLACHNRHHLLDHLKCTLVSQRWNVKGRYVWKCVCVCVPCVIRIICYDTVLLPTTYKTLSNILLTRLIPYAKEIIGDHQCGFRCNRSTIDHIFCIRQILGEKMGMQWRSSSALIDFKKAYDSVRREVLYKILIEFGIPKKLVRLIKMSLTETYSRVWVGKNVTDRFPFRNGLKQGDALSPMFSTLL